MKLPHSSEVLIFLLLLHPPAIYAESEQRIEFDIPAQLLSSAVLQFSQTSGIKTFFKADVARDIKTQSLSGRYTAKQALTKLLEHTGVQYRFTATQSVTLFNDQDSLTSEKLLAMHPMEDFMYAAAEPGEQTYDGPVEQMDMTVQGMEVGYGAVTSSTATKTDTPLLETPMSVQVVPRAVFDDQKSVTIKDALENISGVRPQPTLGRDVGFIIRGFREPKFYRNGLIANSTNSNFPSSFDTANLERLEVLKGPASILFGRIEPGGLINLTTKKPLATPYYSLEQQFGSYDFYRTQWDATGPITDNGELLYRLNGSYLNTDSFRDFIFKDRIMIDASLTWRPSDATEFTLDVEGIDQDYQADFGIPVIGTRPVAIPVTRAFGDPNDPIDHNSKVNLNTEFTHRFNETWTVRNRFLMQRTSNDDSFINPTPAFGDALRADNRTLDRNVFNQKQDVESYQTNFDLIGHFDFFNTRHETLVGIDYLRSFTEYHTQGFFNTPDPALAIDIYNPQASYGIDPSVFTNALSTTEQSGRNFSIFKDQWYGVYFQDHITLWDTLHILGGGRYDWVEAGRGRSGSFAEADAALPAAMREDEGFSPRVGILYQPYDWLGVFGNWTTSFGANNGISATGESFDPQTGEQFEAGFKTELFDQRLVATLAYYYLTKENLLTPDLDTPDPDDRVAIGQQRSQGIELDISGQITDELSIVGSYAYTDAQIIRDNRELNGQINGYEGNTLPNVPEHAGSLWLKYDIKRIASLRGLSFGIGTYAVGQREGDYENSFQLPGYVRLDAFAAYRWKVGDAKLTAQFNIRNLLDKTYYESTDPDANVGPRLGVYPGAPLTALGSIRIEY